MCPRALPMSSFCSIKMGLKCLSLREGRAFGGFILTGHRPMAYKAGEFGKPDCPSLAPCSLWRGRPNSYNPRTRPVTVADPCPGRIRGPSGPEAALTPVISRPSLRGRVTSFLRGAVVFVFQAQDTRALSPFPRSRPKRCHSRRREGAR